MQEAAGFSNQRDTGVRGVQEPSRREVEQRRNCLKPHQTLLALKMEEGQPAEEDRSLWEPQKARKWILACSIQNKGSLRGTSEVCSPHCKESTLVCEVRMLRAIAFLGC